MLSPEEVDLEAVQRCVHLGRRQIGLRDELEEPALEFISRRRRCPLGGNAAQQRRARTISDARERALDVERPKSVRAFDRPLELAAAKDARQVGDRPLDSGDRYAAMTGESVS